MARAKPGSRVRAGTAESNSGLSASESSPAANDALVAALVIIAATGLVYGGSLHGSFQFDDRAIIVGNRSLHDLRAMWPPSGTRWFGELTFALNYWFGGLDPFGYHLTNVIIHECSALLVAALAGLTLRTPALTGLSVGPLTRRFLPLTAGVLFAIHPIQTQAVTYVVQRFASLATFFFLVSVVLYVWARLRLAEDGRMSASVAMRYGLSFVAAVAAMKTKEISVTLPIVLGVYEVLFFGIGWRALLVTPIAATTLLVPLALAGREEKLIDVLGEPTRYAVETRDISRWEYLLTQTRVVWTYLRLLVLPVHQNLDYEFPISRSIAEPRVLASIAGLVLLASTAAVLLVRDRRARRARGVLAFFGLAWFFVTIAVESSVIPIRDVIFEHRVYLPSVGAMIALATGLLGALERLRLRASAPYQVAAALALTAAPLGVATHARNAVWRDEISLWQDVVAKSPRKVRPHNNLACLYEAAGEFAAAEREAREAIRLAPGEADAHLNLGNALQATGRPEEAMTEYREAARLDPRMAEPRSNLCHLYLESSRVEEALAECLEARRLDPGLGGARNNLGNVLLRSGRVEEAIREYREAIRLDPVSPDPHRNAAYALLTTGRAEEAIPEYLVALSLRPGDAGAHTSLGVAYFRRGELDAAIREYREAIRLDPGLQIARDNLAAAEREKERRTSAR
jgi:Flp pilus assembly protein TadD